MSAPTPTQSAVEQIPGIVVLALALAAFLYAAERGIDFAPMLAIVGPVLAAQLLRPSLARTESQARQAVANTNGALTGGIRDAVRDENKALSEQVAALRAELAQARLPQATAPDAG